MGITKCFLIASAAVWIAVLVSCKTDPNLDKTVQESYQSIRGQVIGTYYAIKYQGDVNFRSDIEALFEEMNQSVSTYVPTSTISRFNQSLKGITYHKEADRHFQPVWENAKSMYQVTGGSFEPTVMPLVNYYGFGYTDKSKRQELDINKVAQLLKWVDFDQMQMESFEDSIRIAKTFSQAELDFSANAKGYYIDEVARFLRSQGIDNFLVDIGGEAYGQGVNDRGLTWTTGINEPMENQVRPHLAKIIQLDSVAVATSGNYINYYINDKGEKYVHTINPTTGLTEQSKLLSATIIASDCMTADALATACMVKGYPQAKAFINTLPYAEGCFIYDDGSDTLAIDFTKGFASVIIQ